MKWSIVAGCVWGCLATSAAAAQLESNPIILDSGLAVTPVLGIATGYDSNVTYLAEDEIDSMFVEVMPRITLGGDDGVTSYQIGYDFDGVNYIDSSSDNYRDHHVMAFWSHEFTVRHSLSANYDYRRGHEGRGTGLSQGDFNEFADPAEFNLHDASLTYGYGIPNVTFNGDLTLAYEDKTYADFREISRYRDYSYWSGTGSAAFPLAPRTSSSTVVQIIDKEFKHNRSTELNRDSKIYRAATGISWEATGKTTGYMRFGAEKKDFDASERDDFTGFVWEGSVDWSPVSYSRFSLVTNRTTKDPDQNAGDYIESSSVSLTWSHDWLERLDSSLGATYTNDDYKGIDRTDKVQSYSANVRYAFRRWMMFTLAYSYTDKTSDIDSYEYDKNLVSLVVDVTL